MPAVTPRGPSARPARGVAAGFVAALLVICGHVAAHAADPMDAIAEQYVKLVLALGELDPGYVDAYYGPPGWKEEVAAAGHSLEDIDRQASGLLAKLDDSAPAAAPDDPVSLRHAYLKRQLEALRARVAMLGGTHLSFDEESRALYDAVAPRHTEAEFADILAELEGRLPGEGPLVERLDAFRQKFVIPRERLDDVFRAAIDGCRRRTLEHIELPDGEAFTVEYVTGRSWSAYNWYQGNFRSLIQVNTDLPIHVERAIDLACHEGYPGHHVYNVLLEKHLVRDRGWMEFTVYPLYSPQSLIAEGTANFGIEMAFPREEWLKFAREVLLPAAGLKGDGIEAYYEVLELVDRLAYAGNEAARRYLDGKIDARAAAGWLERYLLYPRPRAEQRVRFFDQYRSYVINYNLGKDMVKRHVEARAGAGASAGERWKEFASLLSSPRLPSGLAR